MGLERYSDRELLEELLRRNKEKHAVRSWCEACPNFKTDPSAKESYNPCQKGHKMDFQIPVDYSDEDWGYYRDRCKDRR